MEYKRSKNFGNYWYSGKRYSSRFFKNRGNYPRFINKSKFNLKPFKHSWILIKTAKWLVEFPNLRRIKCKIQRLVIWNIKFVKLVLEFGAKNELIKSE